MESSCSGEVLIYSAFDKIRRLSYYKIYVPVFVKS